MECWDFRKRQLVDIVQKHSNSIFWYLSSGLDLMPLYYLTDEKRIKNPLKEVHLFLFSDYGVVFNDPENLKENIDKKGPEKLPSRKGEFYLTQMIPLHLNHEFLADNKQYSNDKDGATAFGGASVYLLLIRQIIAKEYIEHIPVLFIRQSNRFVLEYLRNKNLDVGYICTVSDGCRPDNKQQCPNNYYKDYTSIMHPKGFWITDHFNQTKPDIFQEITQFSDWGHYDGQDKSYCFFQNYM